MMQMARPRSSDKPLSLPLDQQSGYPQAKAGKEAGGVSPAEKRYASLTTLAFATKLCTKTDVGDRRRAAMPSLDTGEKALRELSRVHAAQLAAYATARLKLQRPDLLTARDRAHLAAADAALAEIRGLLLKQSNGAGELAIEQKN
jgi:hypothetical protein